MDLHSFWYVGKKFYSNIAISVEKFVQSAFRWEVVEIYSFLKCFNNNKIKCLSIWTNFGKSDKIV